VITTKEKQHQEILLLPDEEYGDGFQNDKEDLSKLLGIHP